jgi:hypothetical protein
MILRSLSSATEAPAAEERRPSLALTGALGIAAVAAVSLVLGAVLPVVAGATRGFADVPWLTALAVVPIGVAVGFALRGRHGAAAGVVLALAVLAPGRLLLDLQFIVDPSVVARPELYLPSTLGKPAAGAGVWFLLTGHLLTVFAGLLAGHAARGQAESAGRAQPVNRRWQLIAPTVGLIGAGGLLMAPMRSDDPYLLTLSPLDSPTLVVTGYLVMACVLPLAGLLAVGSGVDGIGRGALLGLASGMLAVALPNLIAGASMPQVRVTPGPVVVVAAAVVLAGLSFLRPGWTSTEGPAGQDLPDMAGSATVPGLFWLRLATGGLGLLTAAATLGGCFYPQVTSAFPLSVPESPARWLLLLAGVVVGVLAVLTMLPPTSAAVRPALSIAWVGVVFAGAAVLGTALAATDLLTATDLSALYSTGPGVFWTVVAMALAALVAGCSVVVGVVEREDADEAGPDGPRPSGAVVTPLAAGAVLAVAAFGTPVFTAPGYVGPGLWTNFTPPSWGLLAALVTVLGAAALVPRSRPYQAAALLSGAVVVLALRAAELPLVGGRVEGAHAGTGFWLALGCLAALVVAGVMAVARRRESA